MLTEKTIRNISKKTWKIIFSSIGIKKYSVSTDAPGTTELKNFIQYIYENSPEQIIQHLDNAIFNEITFNQPNQYRIEKLILRPKHLKIKLRPETMEFLRLNKQFDEEQMTGGTKMKILSSRINQNGDILNKITLLIKIDESSIPSMFGIHNIFFNVTLDFENEMLCIGHHKGNFSKYYDAAYHEVHEKLIFWLSTNIFPIFEVDIDEYNDEKLKNVIFSLYHELTKPIESKLEKSLPDQANLYIAELFEKLGIELKDTYLKQMHSIIFQDYGDQTSSEFKEGLYDNGWIFRFAFKDGDYTKATSRTEDHSPVYTSPIFWNLKELIASKNKLTDAGFVWAVDETKLLEAKIDVHNKGFVVYLYSSGDDWGENRIEFIRKKITEHL